MKGITFKEYLIEVRKNPDQNIKKSPLDQLKDIVNKHGSDCYVRYVNEPKLGHNPQSKWNTPFGLCAYPIEYVIEKNLKVPYAGSMPYMIVFKPKEDVYIWDLGGTDYEKYYQDILKGLRKVLDADFKLPYTLRDINGMVGVWYHMYFCIYEYAMWNRLHHKSKSINIGWIVRKVILAAGYKGVVDPGLGIIHSNEPTQAIFFEVTDLQRIDTIRATYEYDSIEYNDKGESIKKGKRRSNIQEYEVWDRLEIAIRDKKRDPRVEGNVGLHFFKNGCSAENFADLMVKYISATGYTNPGWLDCIKQFTSAIILYCKRVLGGKRWPEVEPFVMKDIHVLDYVDEIIKGRWLEAEPYIAKSADKNNCMIYNRTYRNNERWPDFEKALLAGGLRYLGVILRYAQNVIHGRWPEAEPLINSHSSYKREYDVFCQGVDTQAEWDKANVIRREKERLVHQEKLKKWGMAQ